MLFNNGNMNKYDAGILIRLRLFAQFLLLFTSIPALTIIIMIIIIVIIIIIIIIIVTTIIIVMIIIIIIIIITRFYC